MMHFKRSTALLPGSLSTIRSALPRLFSALALVALLLLDPLAALAQAGEGTPANGPLTVANGSRYVRDGTGKAILLTGSHIWNNLQNWGTNSKPPALDYNAYLDFMAGTGPEPATNFMRMWAWEQSKWRPNFDGDFYFLPTPFTRSSTPGALDGGSKFDLSRVNQVYLDQLRSRVLAAQQRGIYVGVMLFQGFSVERKGGNSNPWLGHPFNAANNINGADGDPLGTGEGLALHTLDSAISAQTRAFQEDYVRAVVDTLNGFDNIVWEISNESHPGSIPWQERIAQVIRQRESTLPNQHLIWISGERNIPNSQIFGGSAELVSPALGGFESNPPTSHQGKVVISDTDHHFGVGGNFIWVWKTVTRGHNPIFMDPFFGNANLPGIIPSDPQWARVREAMADALRYSREVDLSRMIPQAGGSQPCSTGFCLYEQGEAYLVFQDQLSSAPIDLVLPAGDYEGEWLRPDPRATASLAPFTTSGGTVSLQHPFTATRVVLFLKRASKALAVAGPTPSALTVDEGDPASFSVSPSGGSPSASGPLGYDYQWSRDGVPVGGNSNTLSIPATTPADAGTYRCQITDGVGSVIPSGVAVLQVVPNCAQTFPQAPFVQHSVPGRIEAEDYDVGGQGVSYNDTTPCDNLGGVYRAGLGEGVDVGAIPTVGNDAGYHVGWVAPGEWLEYTLSASPGAHDLDLRYATYSASGATLKIEIGGQTFYKAVPRTSSQHWHQYATVTIPGVVMNAGSSVLRVTVEAGALNLNWLDFQAAPGNPVAAVFTPTADTFVHQLFPDNNYGSAGHLRVRATNHGRGKYSFLKFAVSGVSGTVIDAKLRLRTQDQAIVDLHAYPVCLSSWSESTLTWNNFPQQTGAQCGGAMDSLFSLQPESWYEVDATGFITGNGQFTFGLITSDLVEFRDLYSRESIYPPELVVTYQP